MQTQHLTGFKVDQAGTGIAAECRGIVPDRTDVAPQPGKHLFGAQQSRLQPLDAIDAAEDLLLHVGRVVGAEGRIADHDQSPSGQIAGFAR